jgi:diacylglycerol kinase family enzyme
LIIAGKDGSGGTLYRAVLSENKFTLEKTSLSIIPPNSKLLVSEDSEQINRLRSSTVHIIVSAQSGAGLATSAYENILSPLLDLFSIKAAVHATTSKTSHREYLSSLSLSSSKQTIFIILGGDTLIYDFINTILPNPSLTRSHNLTICPLPCGTGNALATSLDKRSISIAISHLFSHKEINPLPLMEITIHEGGKGTVIWGAVVCSWGLHASLVADSDDPEMRRQYGSKRFGVPTIKVLINSRLLQNGF